MKFKVELDNWKGSSDEIDVDMKTQTFTFNDEKYFLKKTKDESGEDFYFIFKKDLKNHKIGVIYKEGSEYEASDLNFTIFRTGQNPYIAAAKLIANIV